MTELSDKCLDPIGQAKFGSAASEKHIDYVTRNSNIVLTSEQVGGYTELMEELFCFKECGYKTRCTEGMRVHEQYSEGYK